MSKVNQLRQGKVDAVYDDYLSGDICRVEAKVRLLRLGVALEEAENNLGLADEALAGGLG